MRFWCAVSFFFFSTQSALCSLWTTQFQFHPSTKYCASSAVEHLGALLQPVKKLQCFLGTAMASTFVSTHKRRLMFLFVDLPTIMLAGRRVFWKSFSWHSRILRYLIKYSSLQDNHTWREYQQSWTFSICRRRVLPWTHGCQGFWRISCNPFQFYASSWLQIFWELFCVSHGSHRATPIENSKLKTGLCFYSAGQLSPRHPIWSHWQDTRFAGSN